MNHSQHPCHATLQDTNNRQKQKLIVLRDIMIDFLLHTQTTTWDLSGRQDARGGKRVLFLRVPQFVCASSVCRVRALVSVCPSLCCVCLLSLSSMVSRTHALSVHTARCSNPSDWFGVLVGRCTRGTNGHKEKVSQARNPRQGGDRTPRPKTKRANGNTGVFNTYPLLQRLFLALHSRPVFFPRMRRRSLKL